MRILLREHLRAGGCKQCKPRMKQICSGRQGNEVMILNFQNQQTTRFIDQSTEAATLRQCITLKCAGGAKPAHLKRLQEKVPRNWKSAAVTPRNRGASPPAARSTMLRLAQYRTGSILLALIISEQRVF